MARRKKGSNRWQKAVSALHQERLDHPQKNNVLVTEDFLIWLRINTSAKVQVTLWAGNIAERDGFHFHQVDPKSKSAPVVVRKHRKSYPYRCALSTAVIAISLLIETTMLHLTFFSGSWRAVGCHPL